MTNLEEKVQDLLNAEQDAIGYGLRVVDDLTRVEDNWTYIVIQPSKAGIRAYDFAEILERIEAKIRESEHANVLIVPAAGELN